MTTNGKSGARHKIHISKNNVSHPIQALDSIKSKKSCQHNISFIKKPTYNIVLKLSYRASLKNHPPPPVDSIKK